ncbi:hypothetical protein [Caulobacter sp. BK020]|uniref:hypothetical protein n=1 Tax=Caulobacter sp. BK020 TaxID=2512117 RepID=UPI0010447494|nr:hypothetical protein [Caulobacter sp. BK020]TCS07530.1 hypothetical protein EV278_12535 [Caulobacter sp. BK020]
MVKAAYLAIGLVLGVAAVAGPALWLYDPVDTPNHIARECRLIAALERERMTGHVERARDTPLPYLVLRAERVSGAPTAFEPKAWRWKIIDRVLAARARKAIAPIACAAAMDRARAPKAVRYLPGRPVETSQRSAYSRAVFWPGDHYALITWSSCDLLPRSWSQTRNVMLLRRTGGVWRLVEQKEVLLMLAARSYRGAAECFAQDAVTPHFRHGIGNR